MTWKKYFTVFCFLFFFQILLPSSISYVRQNTILFDSRLDFYAYVVNNDPNYLALNDLANTSLYGAGLGLNVVTYYDKMLRIEYSINKEFEGGFYLHFEAPF